MQENIIIIGAGPAGLTAAYKLLKSDKNKYNIKIIEKSNTVSGISKTINMGEKYLVDTGIHRFFSKSEEINTLWNEILPNSFLTKDRITRIYYNKKFFDYPVKLNKNTLKNFGIAKSVRIGFSYLKSCIKKKKEDSLENFYINRFGKVLYEIFFKNYTEKVWGISPKYISADWGAQRVKGISIFEILKEIILKNKNNKHTSLIEKFYYPKYGAGQMWQEMAKKIEDMGGKFIFNANIEKIIKVGNEIRKIEYTKNNEKCQIEVDRLISSMPIKDLFKAIGRENVEENIYDLAIKLQYRDFIEVYLVVDKLNLKNETNIKTTGDIVPDNWIYIQDDSVKLGRIQIFNNWSKGLFKNENDINEKVLIGLEYFATEGDKLWEKTEEQMINLAVFEAKKIGIINECKIEEKKSIKIKNAYPAYFGVYEKMPEIEKYLNGINNLYCIGRNGQHRYNNMDHSMMTGIEVARNLVENKKTKEEIWKVNTEKEYHEEIKDNNLN